MKKIIAIMAGILLSATAFAGEFSLTAGARGSFDLNVFDFKIGEPLYYDETIPCPGGGINLFLNLGMPFVEGLGIQPEIGFHVHQIGYKTNGLDKCSDEYKGRYATIDFPILITYKFNIADKFFVQPQLGPRLSWLLGNIFTDNDVDAIDAGTGNPKKMGDPKLDSIFNFGIEVGVSGGMKLGYGLLIVDLRFVRDFTHMQSDYSSPFDGFGIDYTLGAAQSFNFSVGYQIKLL